MNNYNILLASNDPASWVLCSAASIMWHWYELLRGENFSGKHLNEPPDGPWDSWYAHNRGPIAAPSPDMEQPTCTPTEDSHRFCHLVIPKDVVNRICQVVNSHPEGIGLSELRSELMRSNVNMDNDFFVYKKFSFLLKSLSAYLKLQTTVDGQIIVHGNPLKMVKPIIHPQVPEILDQHQPKVTRPLDQPKFAELDDNKLRQSPHLSYDGNRRTVTAESSGRENGATTVLKEKPPSPAYYPEKMDLPSNGPVDKDVMEYHLNSVELNNSIWGFFRKVWRTVIGHDSDASTMKSSNYTEICSTGADNVEMRKCDEKSVSSTVSSSNLNESVLEEKTKINSEAKDKSRQRVGMFPKTVESCNSWNSSTSLDNRNGHFSEELVQMNEKNESNRLFLSMPFWEDMLSFLHTPIGAALISQSKTREQMAQQLQMEGPSHLNTLAVSDLSQLVDLLISEKKWVEESISNTFPFELILSAQTTSSLSNLHLSNELRSILSGESSQSKVRRLPGRKRQYGKKKDIQHGVSSDESSKRPFGKSKREILVDCQKLVAELFNEQPEGFNMGVVRSAFREKYGYDLDYLKLGYPKLAVLLQTIPGVDLGFNCVLPSGKNSTVDPHCVQNDTTVNVTNSNSELSDSTGVHNYRDSTLKEFSPVSKTKSKQSGIFGATHEGMEHVAFDSNSYFLDEFSESEAENSIKDGSDMKRQINNNEGESSLLQLFDSFHSKNDKGTKDQLYNYDVDCSKIDLKLPSHIGVDNIPAFQNSSPKKPQKAYSFISDTVE